LVGWYCVPVLEFLGFRGILIDFCSTNQNLS
jgi:hypothetical protein